MRRYLTMFFISFLLCHIAIAGPSSLWGDLEPGVFQVGFRLVRAVDGSRTFGDQGDRPVGIYLWYPAQKMSVDPFPFGAYARWATEDFQFEDIALDDGYANLDPAIPITRALSPDSLKMLWMTPTAAVRNALPAEGRFPLIVLGQGLYYESPITHAILCEFLASHGFVVATCPLMGPQSRMVQLTVEGLEAQIRDMEFVMGHAKSLDFVDADRIGLMGFDLGGMSALILAMRNPDMDAFLAWDSGILNAHYSGLPRNCPDFKVDRFRIPWMHITQARFIEYNEAQPDSLSLFHLAQYNDIHLLGFRNMQHSDFTSYALLDKRPVPAYWRPQHEDARREFLAACTYARSFFLAHLQKNKQAAAFLELPPEQAVPGIDFLFRRKIAKMPPPTTDVFVTTALRDGAEAAVDLVESFAAAWPNAEVFEENFLNWLGYKFLFFWGDPSAGRRIFTWNAELYPASSNAYDSLGEACMFMGANQSAIQYYRKSLELNPENTNAVRRLEALGAQ